MSKMIVEDVATSLGQLTPNESRGSLDGNIARERLSGILARVSHETRHAPDDTRRMLALQFAVVQGADARYITRKGDFWELRDVATCSQEAGSLPAERTWLVPSVPFPHWYETDSEEGDSALLIVALDEADIAGQIAPAAPRYGFVPFEQVVQLPLAVAYSAFIDEYEMTMVGLKAVRLGVAQALNEHDLSHERLLSLCRSMRSAFVAHTPNP